jgi:hypothetical protein
MQQAVLAVERGDLRTLQTRSLDERDDRLSFPCRLCSSAFQPTTLFNHYHNHNHTDSHWTLLHWASYYSRAEVTQFLVSNKAR